MRRCFLGLSQSKEIAAEGYEMITNAENVSNNETVQTFIKWQDKGMPASACYLLIKENFDLITKLTCNVCGKSTYGYETGDCLKNHMSGRVKIILTEEESGGTYTAVLNAE